MHKICYGIIAFEKPEHIKRKIEALYTKDDFFIIHWNKNSSKQEFLELKEMFKDYPNIYIYSKYRVYWGSSSILYACIYCMKMSLSYRYEHLFILTQQDFPIRSIAYIKKYLHNYIHCSFIKCSLVSKNTPKFDKITKPYFYMNAIIRNPNVHLIDKITTYLSPFYLLEKIHHIKNYKKETHKYTVSYPESKFIIHDPFDLLENSTPYHNITYGPSICLAKKHVEYLIKNSASRKLARALKWHFAPEEYFIQTILKDSDLPSTELLNKQLCITNYDMSKSLNIKTYKGYLNLITSVDIIFLRKIEDLAVMDLLDEYRKNT